MNTLSNEHGQPIGWPVDNWQGAALPSRRLLAGRFCRLEPLDAERHGAALHAAFAQDASGRNWTYLPYGPFADIEAFMIWLAAMAAGSDPLFFAIVSQASGQAVGLTSYLRIAPAQGSIEVGHLHFSPAMQRTPLATEAMFLLMEEAFALGYRRYEWKCNALNRPSRQAAQRLGFSYEGIFRQALVVKGRNRDTAWYAMIDQEWPALKAALQSWLAPENFTADGMQRISLSTLTAPLLVAKG